MTGYASRATPEFLRIPMIVCEVPSSRQARVRTKAQTLPHIMRVVLFLIVERI